MKQKLLALGILITLSISSLNAQPIKIHRFQGGYKYTQDKKVLKLKHLANVVGSDEKAYDLAVQAKSFSDLGFIISFIGGAFVGAPIGKALAGGEPKWLSAGIGGGLILSGLQFYRISASKAKTAIDIHNTSLSLKAPRKSNLYWAVSLRDVGLRINF